MENYNKENGNPSGAGSAADIPLWISSLVPVMVAFACYVGLILATAIEPRDRLIAYGAAAAFIGLECYWILRGLRDEHFGTMVTGFIGAALAILVLDRYLSLV
jgi:hypothetical protein